VKGLKDEIGHIWTASNPFLTAALNVSDRQRNKLVPKMLPAFRFWQAKCFQVGTNSQAFAILRTTMVHHPHQAAEAVQCSLWEQNDMGEVCLPGCWEVRQLARTSSMGFTLKVTNWLPADWTQLVGMVCLDHKCLYFTSIRIWISGPKMYTLGECW
jgi:hypothetical protein